MIQPVLAAVLLLQGPLLWCGVQDPAPATPPATPPAVPTVTRGPQELLPGALPQDASPAARECWSKLVAALKPVPVEGAGGGGEAAIDAFDLWIDTRVTSESEQGGKQTNDLKMRYRYLGPGFVRTTMLDSRVDRLRGPDGDWLLDPAKGDAIELRGQDFAQDRRELGQTLSIARNYLALAEPARLRIATLEMLSGPPAGLPSLPKDKVRKDTALPRAAELTWIALTSPDFQVVEARKSKQALMYRVQLGLDPKTHLPLLATIWQDEAGTMVAEGAVLVDLIESKHFRPLDGRTVPGWFNVYDARLPSSPFVFQDAPRASVFVKPGSTLRPKLTADDFRPQRAR